MTVCCPVCRREVHTSEYSGRVPMSGHTIPIDQLERKVA